MPVAKCISMTLKAVYTERYSVLPFICAPESGGGGKEGSINLVLYYCSAKGEEWVTFQCSPAVSRQIIERLLEVKRDAVI